MWSDEGSRAGHLPDREIAAFGRGEGTLLSLARTAQHLRNCTICRGRFLRLSPASALAFEDAEQEMVEYIGSAAAESEVALEEAVAVALAADLVAAVAQASVKQRTLFVAVTAGATRAAHQLWLAAPGDPSPLLPAQLIEHGFLVAPAPAE